MGYVGVTLAAMFANKGLKVFGVEIRDESVSLLNSGRAPFHEKGLDIIVEKVVRSGYLVCGNRFPPDAKCRAFVITVGTPLNSDGTARVDMITRASREVGDVMTEGSLVVLRSTTLVGTTRQTVKPVLDKAGKHYFLAMCPERTLEGNAVKELEELPQIIGGLGEEASDHAARLFEKLTSTTIKVGSPETAEMIKLIDNTYRDVCFAFANEVAKACESVGVKAAEVIQAGKLGYSRTNVAMPGPVGGPCLEKDPHILMQSVAKFSDDELSITRAARATNESQPSATIAALSRFSTTLGHKRELCIVIGGLAFKGRPETDDLRGSMAFPIYREVLAQFENCKICVFDAVIKQDEIAKAFPGATVITELTDALNLADIFIIANNHPVFSEDSIGLFESHMHDNALVYDYWNHFSLKDCGSLAGRYFSVGNMPHVPEVS
jgi:UDP-N-acetyl-D-mannosaminuronic acid dehydrogenase